MAKAFRQCGVEVKIASTARCDWGASRLLAKRPSDCRASVAVLAQRTRSPSPKPLPLGAGGVRENGGNLPTQLQESETRPGGRQRLPSSRGLDEAQSPKLKAQGKPQAPRTMGRIVTPHPQERGLVAAETGAWLGSVERTVPIEACCGINAALRAPAEPQRDSRFRNSD